MGEGFCCPARRKNADNPLCIARFFNAAGRQKTRSDGVNGCEYGFLNAKKVLEKRRLHVVPNSSSVSCFPPDFYANRLHQQDERFERFIKGNVLYFS
ncbi:hypothetical protein D1157_00945 [Anaerotruncus sp. X29]|nr:hypothetical protein [Anaerotruncus sp. X29]